MDLPYIYQLQGLSFESLYEQDVDVAVVDMDDSGLTRNQVARLEAQDKRILTYVSIGEAEDYRDYWPTLMANNSDLLMEENSAWEGNYRVEFWRSEWQGVILDRISAAVDHGYAGVYLDIVDAYTVASVQARYDGADLRQEMIDFVVAISEHAKALDPNFLIVPQNAVGLLGVPETDPTRPNTSYLDAIDGIGVEDLWFDDDRRSDWTRWDLEFLELAKRSDKFVLATSYPTHPGNQAEFVDKALDQGFLPFVADRALNGIPEVNADTIGKMQGHDVRFPTLTTHGSSEADSLFGGAGGDTLWGGAGNDTIQGGDGDDVVWGGAGADRLYGNSGNDEIGGGKGDDVLWGGTGADRLYGAAGADTLGGGDGSDVLYGGDRNDILYGGDGDDVIWGGTGADRLYGGSGNDEIGGGDGDDMVNGASGNDTLYGADGADTLAGGNGDDVLYGGAGFDVFVFVTNGGTDTITDFEEGDRINLSGVTTVSQFTDLDISTGVDWIMIQTGGDTDIFISGDFALDASDFLF